MAGKKTIAACVMLGIGICVRLGFAEDQIQTQSASAVQMPTASFVLPSMSAVFECFQMPTLGTSFSMSLAPQDLPSALRPAPITVPVVVMPNTGYQDRISQIVQSRNNAFSQGRFIMQEEKEIKFKRIVDASNPVLSADQAVLFAPAAQEKSE